MRLLVEASAQPTASRHECATPARRATIAEQAGPAQIDQLLDRSVDDVAFGVTHDRWFALSSRHFRQRANGREGCHPDERRVWA
jgi:hypothetical protein